MPSLNSRSIIAVGFAIVLGLVILVSVVGLVRLSDIKSELNRVTDLHHQKSEIITEMHQIINARTKLVFLIALSDDPFERDDYLMQHKGLADRFVLLRSELQKLPATPEEQEALYKALAAITHAQPIQEAIVEKIITHPDRRFYDEVVNVDTPNEEKVFAAFENFLNVEQDVSHRFLSEGNDKFRGAIAVVTMLDVLIVALGAIVAFFVLRYTTRIENELSEEKQLAQITLRSMSDAVVTTNKDGKIVYANPAAEQLLGNSVPAMGAYPINSLINIYCSRDDVNIDLTSLLHNAHATALRVDDCTVLIRQSNVEFYVEGLVTPIRNELSKTIGLALVFRDVTHSRNLANQLTWQATHDALTGLINRAEFERLLSRAIDTAASDQKHHAMLYIDLDQFKLVNDTCGHFAGDKLLQQVTSTIQSEIRTSDVLARLGGDEFGLLLENCPQEQAERIAQHILATIQGFRFVWAEKIFKVGASIGLAIIDYRSDDAVHVLRAADAACYVAKDKGRNRVWVHRDDDAEIAQRRGEMEVTAKIHSALEDERFCLMKQRINPLSRDHKGGSFYELLVRMVMPNKHLMLPMSFIPAAERYGMMVNVDRWVIRNALTRLAEIDEKEIGMVSINLSGQSFSDETFLDFIVNQFDVTGVDPERVCFEITETTAIANWMRVTRFMAVLRGMGCKFALDDFGSGMSSFSYLKNLPVDFIKIEGTIIREIDTDRVHQAMVEAIHSIGRVMNIKTVAEYIERESVIKKLSKIGIDYAQGNILHKPEPL